MYRHIVTAFAALLIHAASAQQVQQVTIGDNYNFGLTYSLPATSVQLTIEASCTTSVAGPYAIYAEKFLGLTDVVLADQTLWQVESVTLEAVARPDSLCTYHIGFSEKGPLPTFYLTPDRCLWGINQQPEEPEAKPQRSAEVDHSLTYRPTDVLTPDMLKAGSKSKQAELIAQEIFSIRESRSELIRGEADNVPNDGRQLQLMLDNLSAQEAALMTYFVGTTTVTRHTYQCVYDVPAEPVVRALAFRFSSQLGLVDNDDLAGAPYYVSVQVTEDNRLPEILDPKVLKKLEKGIAYCVPGKAQVRVFSADRTFAEAVFPMAQFGHVERLPQGQFVDKKHPCSALFVPTTGALRMFDPVGAAQ